MARTARARTKPETRPLNLDAPDPNPREHLGANNPPEGVELPLPAVELIEPARTSIDRAREAIERLGQWTAGHPVVQTKDEADAGATLVKVAAESLREMETDRDAQVRPLNTTVREINATFKAASDPLDRVLKEVRRRLTAFAEAEEARRREEARRLAAEAAERERLAREAEAREREALENAQQGEVGLDVAQHVQEADDAFRDFGRAAREAQRADRNVGVKLAGGDGAGRALSLRGTEVLDVVDPLTAVEAMLDRIIGQAPEALLDVIRSMARAHRKLYGELPAGVTSRTVRSV